MLGTSCIFVVAVELTLATFCNFFMILHHFCCGAQGVLPEPCAHRASFCVFCVHQIHNA